VCGVVMHAYERCGLELASMRGCEDRDALHRNAFLLLQCNAMHSCRAPDCTSACAALQCSTCTYFVFFNPDLAELELQNL